MSALCVWAFCVVAGTKTFEQSYIFVLLRLGAACALLGSGLAALNDLTDAAMDRASPLRETPVSRGSIQTSHMLAMVIPLIFVGTALAFATPCPFRFILLAAVWSAYAVPPFRLKKRYPWSNICNFSGGFLLVSLGARAAGAALAAELLLATFGGAIILAGHFTHQAADIAADKAAGHSTLSTRTCPRHALDASVAAIALSLVTIALAAHLGHINPLPFLPLAVAAGFYGIFWVQARQKASSSHTVTVFRERYRSAYLIAGILSIGASLLPESASWITS